LIPFFQLYTIDFFLDTEEKGTATGDRHTEETTLMGQNKHNQQGIDLSENYSMHWHDGKSPDATKGVALVIHGLNLRPEKMESIIKILTHSGIDTLNLSLHGHGENYSRLDSIDTAKARLESFKKVSYQLWLEETYAAYKAARNRSDHRNVPLFFVGYSLGGLIGLDLFASKPEVKFDRMVLFSPALKMHLRNFLIKILSPFPRLTLPSFVLQSYQSNDGTPMAAYNVFFESYKQFHQNMSSKINVPTVIFIDQGDEIVSYRRLKKMVENEALNQWIFHIVQKEKTGEPGKIHHVIIDEPSTGENVCRKMMEAMVSHLYNDMPGDRKE
jgi:esterase/lipase